MHGSPADEDEYVVTASDAAPLFQLLGAPLTFFGHTHRQGGFRLSRRTVAQIAPDRILAARAELFLSGKPRIGGAAAGR